MNESGRRAFGFSRDEIGVSQLETLEEKFADGSLNEDEFISLFREIVYPAPSKLQLIELFRKIDANSDGTVDWDELTNYMFLDGSNAHSIDAGEALHPYYETNQAEAKSHSHKRSETRPEHNPGSTDEISRLLLHREEQHKECVTRILRVEKPNLYITTSKDGTVRTWNPLTLEYQGCLTMQNSWITDCCYMKRSNRLAITCMNRNLSFYDLNAHGTIGQLPDYSKKQCIPLCIAYIDEAYDSMEALVVGDDSGGMTVMKCSTYWNSIDPRSLPKRATANVSVASSVYPAENHTGGLEISTLSRAGTPSSSVLDQRAFASQVRLKKHSDWITRIKWVGEIQAIIAGSLDSTISIVDVDRMVTKFEYTQHKKSVYDLIWCPSARLVASCGQERDISIWNPYSCQRAVGTLRGHNTSVCHLASDDINQQLISVSSENVFKIWDLRMQRCLQTFTDTFASTGGARHTVSSIFHDPKLSCLMSATLGLSRWPFKQVVDEELGSLDNHPSNSIDTKSKDVLIPKQRSSRDIPVSLAIYNDVFHQIVTADSESIVRIWSAESGQGTFHFENAHGSSPITAITFDSAGRRLLTGAHDGTCIFMWNFSNGALVKKFYKNPKALSDQDTPKSRPYKLRRSAGRQLTIPNAPCTPRIPYRPTFSRHHKILEFACGEDREVGGKMQEGSEELCESKMTQLKSEDERPKTSRKNSIRFESVCEENEESTEDEEDDKYMGDFIIEMRENRFESPKLPSSPSKGPERKTAEKYGEKKHRRGNEITCILDIERNIRVGMADCVCQRLICSVGWDDMIYLWEDKVSEKESYPLDTLPHSSSESTLQDSTVHIQDLLVIVFIPPSHIATAGGDGQIFLWSLNSRKLVMQLYKGIGSIEAMVYAEKLELLLAAGEGENLICINPHQGTCQMLSLKLSKYELDSVIVSMRCDKASSVIVTGDSAGLIKLWDLQINDTNTSILLGYICHWKLGHTSIVSLDLLESSLSHQFYILVSCIKGRVTIWTMCGILVGVVGRQRTWKLGHPSTYSCTKSACHWTMLSGERHKGIGRRESLFTQSTSVQFLQMIRTPQILPCAILSTLHGQPDSQEDALLEDVLPRPGEVWICSAGHRGKTFKTSVSPVPGQNDRQEGDLPSPKDVQLYLDHMLQDDLTSVITVIRVSRGEISFWFGFEVESPQQKTIRLNEFVRNIYWKKQQLLTQYIDRTFRYVVRIRKQKSLSEMIGSEASQSYRVSAILVKSMDPVLTAPFAREFWAMDVEGCEHKLQPLNCSVSPARLIAAEAIQLEQMQMEAVYRGTRRDHRPIVGVPKAPQPESRSIVDVTVNSGIGVVSEKESSVRLSSMVTLPRVFQSTEKRSLGGISLKMSAIRMRHDPSFDFRRIYNLDKVPKQFRALLNQNCELNEKIVKEMPKKLMMKSLKERRVFEGIVPMSQ